MFWWRADNGEPCPVCVNEDDANHEDGGYAAMHPIFARLAPRPDEAPIAPRGNDAIGI